MNWKLPYLFRNPLDFINTNKKPPEQVNGELLDDEEDDLGIKLVQHKGTVPFRRVESSVHTFVNVALPADLDRLHRHQCNIRKWRKSKEFWKLQEEYINSGRTVQQLTRNINEMELLRARVIEEDLPIFDQHLDLAKEKAKASINEFLEIHDEGLKSDGSIVGSLDQRSNKDNPETVGNRLLQSSVSGTSISSHTVGDHFVSNYHGSSENISNMPEEKNIHEDAFVQLRGNRLVIESSCSSRGDLNEYGAYEKQDDDTSSAEEADESNFQILELDSRQEEANVEEWWDKLRKDIVDLNTVMNDFSSLVHDQGKMVDDISSNIEDAETNINEGKSQLRKATILKAAMFPILGAVVGGAVGGPIGMVAGFKLGSVTTGLAAAGVTGTIIGYQGGKALKKRQDANSFEMKEIKQKHEETDNVIDDDTTT
ncbi:syntaxin-17-like [Styela clava]